MPVETLPLEQAAKRYNFVSARLKELPSNEGSFVYLPSGSENSIEISGLTQVYVGKNAQVTIKATDDCYLDIALEANARVTTIFHGSTDTLRASLKESAHFEGLFLDPKQEKVERDLKVVLRGENGEAELKGIWSLDGKQTISTNVLMEHVAPHCRSLQHFKGVLDDASTSYFEGKIYVHPEAQKTDAFQRNNNLLLSDRANAYAKPNLEIFADDVKASHGATIGQFDEDELFYLRTRGLSEKVAKKLLVKAFLGSCIKATSLN